MSVLCDSLKIEDISFPLKITLQSKGKLVFLDSPKVMGIINTTPDSFFSGSRVGTAVEEGLRQAEKMLREGADMLDIGGYSTRPGAKEVDVEEELRRTVPLIEALTKTFPETLISIDTFRAKVAVEAVHAGAGIVNDVSAGSLDAAMLSEVGALGVPYVAMHMRGNPGNMQEFTAYEDVLVDILKYFSKKIVECKQAGIKDVILDPGFGFSKTLEQNYWILKNLSYFKTIGVPILVGVSRKSMIYKKLGVGPEEALNGTTALNMAALINGAAILRVHDVKEGKETVELFKQLNA